MFASALKFALYTRCAFGLLILFSLVGNCAGHKDGAVATLIITVLFWGASRIVLEAIDAYATLTANRNEKPPTE